MNAALTALLSSVGRQLLKAGQKVAAKKALRKAAQLRAKARRIRNEQANKETT